MVLALFSPQMSSLVKSSPTKAISSIIDNPPVSLLCDKIREIAKAVFGYLLRIVVFQLGEMQKRSAYTIMRIYQRLTSDPRDEKPFDPTRLAESRRLLQNIGGVEAFLIPEDGQATVHCMTFKSADFFNHFRELGSHPIEIIHEGQPRRVLLNPPPIATKFYLPIIDVRMPDGTLVKGALLPESPPGNQPRPLILHSHSPGRSMCMDRKFIGLHLAAGYDIAVWDPRGTVESTGIPSEGGYYNDAEAVFQHVLSLGYPHNRIYVSGFCKGAACAAYLKMRHHAEGVHFIAGNPYTSMKHVIEGYGWFGKIVAKFGLHALQDPLIPVPPNHIHFNNVGKFRNLPQSEGRFIFLHTDTDKMMPRGSVQQLCQAIHNAGPIHEILRIHPDPNSNGHMQPPYEDPIIWRRYVNYIV